MPALSAAQTVAPTGQAAGLAIRLALAATQALGAPALAAGIAVPVALSAAQAAPLPAQEAALAIPLRLAAAETLDGPPIAATATITGEATPAAPSGPGRAWPGAHAAADDEWDDDDPDTGGDMHLRLITPPAAEPVSLAIAKAHLRVTTDAEDTLIESWIAAAREAVEAATGRALMPQTWELRIERFPAARRGVELPIAPLIAVQSVEYTGTDGTLAVADPLAYTVLHSTGPRAMPSRLLLAPDGTWPAARGYDRQAIRITFDAGYADAATVPASLRAAVLLVLGELYEHREATLPTRGTSPQVLSENPAVKRLLTPFTIWNV